MSGMSLQTKGLLAFAVLTVYAAGLTVFVLDQKEALIGEVEQTRRGRIAVRPRHPAHPAKPASANPRSE
jgi:hypothetical protein